MSSGNSGAGGRKIVAWVEESIKKCKMSGKIDKSEQWSAIIAKIHF